MATEGEYPKVDGDILYGSEVNTFRLQKLAMVANANIQKSTFINPSNRTFNFNDMNNLSFVDGFIVDGFGTADFIDTGDTTMAVHFIPVDFTKESGRYSTHRAYVAKINTELGSIGAESTDITSSLDLKTFSGDSEIIMIWRTHSSQNTAQTALEISNGATHVVMYLHQTGDNPPDSHQDVIRVKIDKTAEEAFVSFNGGAFGGAIDISSVTTNWFVRIRTGLNSTLTVDKFGYIDGTGDSVDYVSETETFSETKNMVGLTYDYNGSETITGYVSGDDGSNYTECSKDVWVAIGTPGTDGKIKLTVDTPSTIDATDANSYIDEIKMVGGYFIA